MDLGTGADVSLTGAAPSPAVSSGAAAWCSDADRAFALERVNRRPRPRVLVWFWEWAKVCSLAVLLFLFVRAFFVEAYKIPSGSMERTILVGDFLLVNKLGYGAEVPFTKRHLPRLQRPRRGQVVVFTWPKDPDKNLVKRIIGVQGDTLAMRAGVLLVNNVPRTEAYAEHTEPGSDPAAADFEWQTHFAVRTAAAAPLARSPLDRSPLERSPLVGPRTPLAPLSDPTAHPSRDNWGPLIVPPGHYFVLGDNRDNSLDSRYWGFVADSLVIGRPLFVYYSYAPDTTTPLAWATRVRWRRLFTRVQ
ncbi:MAG TPA: signal peptidase I [Gemmatirosa sp.]